MRKRQRKTERTPVRRKKVINKAEAGKELKEDKQIERQEIRKENEIH